MDSAKRTEMWNDAVHFAQLTGYMMIQASNAGAGAGTLKGLEIVGGKITSHLGMSGDEYLRLAREASTEARSKSKDEGMAFLTKHWHLREKYKHLV